MGSFVAVDLANLRARGELDLETLRAALAGDPASVERLAVRHTPGFAALADRVRDVLEKLSDGQVDAAAIAVDSMLRYAPSQPHLAKEHGQWRIHHHPRSTGLVAMWSAITAESLARLIADGAFDRVDHCADDSCRRLFLDTSRNATKQYCSTRCQNRVKIQAFRARRRVADSA